MCICHIVSEYKNNLFLSQIKVLFENSVHLSHSFRIESGSRLITASTAAPPCGPHPRHSPPHPDRTSGLVTPSPPTSALIVAERRHSAITRYAERSAVCRDSARPCCRRAGGTPLLQRRSLTARAVSPSVNPRQRRGYTHRRTCAAERRRWHTPALHLQRHRLAVHTDPYLQPRTRSGVN